MNGRWIKNITVVGALFAGALSFGNLVWAAEERSYPVLFGANEITGPKTQVFPKWIGVLDRHFAEESRGDAPCGPAASRAACAIAEWTGFIEAEKRHDKKLQLDAVNAHLNLHRYILDIVGYGVLDYWATPREFAVNDGNCEDFAIAKYFTLRKLGWSAEDLRVVILRDLNLRTDHAILVTYVDGKAYVLDNQVKQVVPAEAIHHYRPIYSVNEERWWMHAPPVRLGPERPPRDPVQPPAVTTGRSR